MNMYARYSQAQRKNIHLLDFYVYVHGFQHHKKDHIMR
jgi:hypothetical protein